MTVELVQGSQEWLQVRVGKVTASRVHDVVAKTKTGWSSSRENYRAELVVERIVGLPYPQYTNSAMQWGSDTEPMAVEAYCLRDILQDVIGVGFVTHPTILMCGASPDRLVAERGLLEVKCPNSATHWRTLRGAPIAAEYITQMQMQMACTQREWCDWVSYDPRMPEKLQLFVKRVERDDKRIGELEAAIRDFLAEVDDEVAWAEQYGCDSKTELMAKLKASHKLVAR